MQVYRVQFKETGKRYFFQNSHHLPLNYDDYVVVETIRGLELGKVKGPIEIEEDVSLEIKDILRIATKEDLERYNRFKEEATLVVLKVKEEVSKLKLDMKVLEAEYTLDRSKLIIYFESETRVDFRELVKVLAELYHIRIELRQVGSRDGAKVFGGVGPCGMVVCCKSFLTEFDTITVKMAKNQNLALNPVKISGNCGKLLCCISYENDNYLTYRKDCPKMGDVVKAVDGLAKVIQLDPLNKTIRVRYLDNLDKIVNLKIEDVTFEKSSDVEEFN